MDPRRLLIVVSAPSGAGKTSLCEKAASSLPNLVHSVSYTTRPPRPDEQEGKDYYFIKEEEFWEMVKRGEFAEWAQVHGNLYGTSRLLLEKHFKEGNDVILDIDTQGAAQLKKAYSQGIFIYILPPSLEMLEVRLRHRKTDSEEEIQRRLKKAKEEIKNYSEYQYVIVNDVFEKAVYQLASIIIAERCKSTRFAFSDLKDHIFEGLCRGGI